MHRSLFGRVLALVTIALGLTLAVPLAGNASRTYDDPWLDIPHITVTMLNSKGYCVPTYTATGFDPNESAHLTGYYYEDGTSRQIGAGWSVIEIDEAGEVSGRISTVRVLNNSSHLTFAVRINGIQSWPVPFTC